MQGQYQQLNLIPLHRAEQIRNGSVTTQKNSFSSKSINQTLKSTAHKKTSNNHEKQQNQNSTWPNNMQHSSPRHTPVSNALTEHICTYQPAEQEQEQLERNENMDEERNDDDSPINNNDDQCEASTNLKKRAFNGSNDFITVGANKIRKKNHNDQEFNLKKNERQTTTTMNNMQNKYR